LVYQNQHIERMVLDWQLGIPIMICTFSVMVPLPDWVNAPTGPNTLSAGGAYASRAAACEPRGSPFCLILITILKLIAPDCATLSLWQARRQDAVQGLGLWLA